MRSATAIGKIHLTPSAFDLALPRDGSSNSSKSLPQSSISDVDQIKSRNKARSKGDVLVVAQLAAIMASKQTSDLIPLCHPIPISNVDVSFDLDPQECSITCRATVECQGRTGVEMEALTAVSVGLLTVWDMLKAVAGKEMVITDIMVINKSGGASGDFRRLLR